LYSSIVAGLHFPQLLSPLALYLHLSHSVTFPPVADDPLSLLFVYMLVCLDCVCLSFFQILFSFFYSLSFFFPVQQSLGQRRIDDAIQRSALQANVTELADPVPDLNLQMTCASWSSFSHFLSPSFSSLHFSFLRSFPIEMSYKVSPTISRLPPIIRFHGTGEMKRRVNVKGKEEKKRKRLKKEKAKRGGTRDLMEGCGCLMNE